MSELTPLSRVEQLLDILQNGGELPADFQPRSRVEVYLAALVKKGLGSGSSGGNQGTSWKTVVDYTLTEGATEIIVNADTEGNPFSLVSAGVTVLIPQNADNATGDVSVWVYFDSSKNGFVRHMYTLYGTTSNNRQIIYHVDALGDRKKTVTGHGVLCTYSDDARDAYFSYTSLHCQTADCFFPAGTRIIIAGIPADGGDSE